MNIGNLIGINLDIPLWVLLVLGILLLYYIYMTWNFDTFKKLGIPGPKPIIGLGNIYQLIKQGFQNSELGNRKKYGKVFGIFIGSTPTLIVHDLDMLRQILVKEFAYFPNRLVTDFFDPNDPFSRMLTMARDDHWKHMRTTLSPTFSAGKLKMMNKQINWCADQLVEHISQCAEKNSDMELKELMGAYTMDVIASTGFGLQLDTNKNPNNKFIVTSKKLMEVTFGSPRILISMLFPFLRKVLVKIFPPFPKDVSRFFTKVSMDIVEGRKANKSSGNVDFVQLMTDNHVDDNDSGRKTSNNGVVWNQNGLTSKDIIANSGIFLLAGYDTTSSTLCFALYHLAVNQEYQDKLLNEIEEHIQGQEPQYDDLPKMTYLQQVIDETLRLYPPAPRVERGVENDITINGVEIKKGWMVGIPIYCLHMDPDAWPEPESFDPERFTTEMKTSRDPLQYMPFGYGPRNCIGMRLALMEMKIGIIKILQKYRIVTCEKSQIPIRVNKLRVTPEGGAWVRAEARS